MHRTAPNVCTKDPPPCHGPSGVCTNAYLTCPDINPDLRTVSGIVCYCFNLPNGPFTPGVPNGWDTAAPISPAGTQYDSCRALDGTISTPTEWDCYNRIRCQEKFGYHLGSAVGVYDGLCGGYNTYIASHCYSYPCDSVGGIDPGAGGFTDEGCPSPSHDEWTTAYMMAQFWWPYVGNALLNFMDPYILFAAGGHGYCRIPFLWVCPPDSNVDPWEDCCIDEIVGGGDCPPGQRRHPTTGLCIELGELGPYFVLDHQDRFYAVRIDVDDDSVILELGPTEIGPVEDAKVVQSGHVYRSPWIILSGHYDERIYVTYQRNYGPLEDPGPTPDPGPDYDVFVRYSDNRGDDWSDEVALFPDCLYSRSFSDHQGHADVFCAIKPLFNPSTGALEGSQFKIRIWPFGETAPLPEFVAKYWNGTTLIDLALDFDSYMVQVSEGQTDARWVLYGRTYGGSAISILLSTDGGKTWRTQPVS